MLLRLLRPLAPLALLAPGLAATPARGAAPAPLPYRFLVVIHDQWKDPASEVIQERNEFSLLCSLLRSWGLPFAIHRLDQQRFDAYHLLDREGRPLYGTILWNAPGAALDAHGTGTLRLLVRDHGVGLVAFSDTVENPVIAELAGLRPQGKSTTTGRLEPAGEHFITRGVEPNPPVPVVTKLHRSPWTTANQPTVSGPNVALAGATAIARSGSQPLLTVHAHPGGGRVVWLDVERSSGRLFRQEMRDILKRALVWVQGYALYAEYPRSVVLSMDDMGSSD
ncbi:MAG: hypothetical protein FJ399_19035, partial [Verrucomicrobia bacterium]|nr:hypothetical protein [Verrucomicrobiota bacterium]